MTKDEAIQAMIEGKKVRHINLFLPHEWVSSESTGTIYEFEDGYLIDATTFWEDRMDVGWFKNWELFRE